MRTVLIGSDFMYNSSGQLVPIEINTNSNVNATALGYKKTDFFDLSGLISFISEHNFTKMTYIGGIVQLESQLRKLCSSMGITFQFFMMVHGVTIPYVEDAENHLIIRSGYDGSAIVDSEYCKSKVNFMNLIKSSKFKSQFAYVDETGSLVNNITTIPDNGNHPNFILKSTYPHYNKMDYPKYYKLSTQDELDVVLQGLTSEYFLMEYHFNPNKLYEGQIQIFRSFNILFPPDLKSISLGAYRMLSGRKIDNLTVFDSNSHELSPRDKLKYVLVDGIISVPKLLDTDLVEMADGTFKTGEQLEIGNIIKTIKIPNPEHQDLGSPCTDYTIDYTTFLSGTTYSTNKVLDKIRVNKFVPYVTVYFSDGTTWEDTESSSYLLLRGNDDVRFGYLDLDAENCPIQIGDNVILINSAEGQLTTVLKEVIDIVQTRLIFGGWEITVEEEHLFLTKAEDSDSSYVAIEHNKGCTKGCCTPGCASNTCTSSQVCCTPTFTCTSMAGCLACVT